MWAAPLRALIEWPLFLKTMKITTEKKNDRRQHTRSCATPSARSVANSHTKHATVAYRGAGGSNWDMDRALRALDDWPLFSQLYFSPGERMTAANIRAVAQRPPPLQAPIHIQNTRLWPIGVQGEATGMWTGRCGRSMTGRCFRVNIWLSPGERMSAANIRTVAQGPPPHQSPIHIKNTRLWP